MYARQIMIPNLLTDTITTVNQWLLPSKTEYTPKRLPLAGVARIRIPCLKRLKINTQNTL